MKCTLVLAFIAVCVCTTLAADIIQASRDVTIFQNPATNANSKGSFMHVGGATGSRRRSIINFDVTALTADPTEVILNLYMADFSAAAAGSVKVNIYPMNSAPAWHEGSAAAEDAATIGIPAGPEDPTWTQASYPGISWGIDGGSYNLLTSASVNVLGGGWVAVSSKVLGNSQLLEDVKQWRTGVNNGWILIADDSADSTLKRFTTKDYFDVTKRPFLDIKYAGDAPTPTATGDGAGGGGGGGIPIAPPGKYIDFTKPAPGTEDGLATASNVITIIAIIIPGIIMLVGLVIVITIRLRARRT